MSGGLSLLAVFSKFHPDQEVSKYLLDELFKAEANTPLSEAEVARKGLLDSAKEMSDGEAAKSLIVFWAQNPSDAQVQQAACFKKIKEAVFEAAHVVSKSSGLGVSFVAYVCIWLCKKQF